MFIITSQRVKKGKREESPTGKRANFRRPGGVALLETRADQGHY